MKGPALLLGIFVFAATLGAQQSSTSTSYLPDINGRMTPGAIVMRTKHDGRTDVTEKTTSINGRLVPLERVEERVIRDDASGSVVERLVRKYDANGNPAQIEKTVIEEQKRSDGSSTTRSTTYRSNINGDFQLQEQSITETHKQGATSTAETVIQRPSVNGGLAPVERWTVVTDEQPQGKQKSTTIYRSSGNGGFYEAVRQTMAEQKKGNETIQNTALYLPGATGEMQFDSQTVTDTVKAGDGYEVSRVNIYGRDVPGVVSPDRGPKLKEEQTIERKPGGGNTVVETVSVRRPTLADPNRLGSPQRISETICRGKCEN